MTDPQSDAALFGSSDELFDLGALADSVAEVVQLCTANLTAPDDLYLFHVGRMDRERLFNAAAVCDAANLERLRDPAAAATDDRALEDLGADPLSLFDPVVDPYGVSDVELRDLSLHLLIDKHVDLVVHFSDLSFFAISKRSCRAAEDRLGVHTPHTPEDYIIKSSAWQELS